MKRDKEALALLFIVIALAVLAVVFVPDFSDNTGFAIGNTNICVQGTFDSDSGGSIFVKGFSTFNVCIQSNVSDTCISPCSLREYDSGSSLDFNCSNGCVQGACLRNASVNFRLAQYCYINGYATNLTEVCGNGLDDDFDGQVDEGCVGTKLVVYSALDNADTHDEATQISNSYDLCLSSRWSSLQLSNDGSNNVGVDIVFDLGAVQKVSQSRFSFYQWNASRVYQYNVAVSISGNSWSTVVNDKSSSSQQFTVDSFNAVDARYVRLRSISQNQGNWAGLYEAEFYGQKINNVTFVCGNGQCESGEDYSSCSQDCPAVATCSDGIQNQGETGVDCGGPCAACSIQTELGLYELYEISLTDSQSYSNPYTQASVSATFTGTSGNAQGKTMTVKGFWDGGDNWKVRFAPSYTGAWSYSTSSSDSGLSGKSGIFTVGSSSKKGRVQIDSSNPLYFKWSNGERYL